MSRILLEWYYYKNKENVKVRMYLFNCSNGLSYFWKYRANWTLKSNYKD